MPGYISLHRDIQKHWLYEEERVFSRYEAWLDILMRVNHAEGKVTHNGTVETIPRGSTIWSMGDMEKSWKWSNKKVKRFLVCLESDQMLSMRSTTKKTYLTVINYDKYQGSDVDKAPPKHHQSTTEAFQKHTNNNVNNDKEIKHIVDSNECDIEFEKWYAIYPKQGSVKKTAQASWKNLWRDKKIDLSKLMTGTHAYVKYQNHHQYKTCGAQVFLNQQRWNDDWSIQNEIDYKPTNKMIPQHEIVTMSKEERDYHERVLAATDLSKRTTAV